MQKYLNKVLSIWQKRIHYGIKGVLLPYRGILHRVKNLQKLKERVFEICLNLYSYI